MKAFRVVIENNAFKNAIKAIKHAASTGTPHVRSGELVCGSVKLAYGSFSQARLEAFYTILNKKPKSLQGLAEIMGKSRANVWRDAKALELLGLIELRSEKVGARESLRPIARYGSITFDFEERKKASNE